MPTDRSSGTRYVQNQQLYLPLFEPLVEHGLQQIHHWPWVSDEEKIRRGRRPAPEAWDNWPYVESHPAHTYAGLFFDIDNPETWEYEVDGPCPNWQIRKEGLRTTYHVAYTLEIPVARHNAAQERIVNYYRDIYDGLSCLFDADPRFDGVMAKNPLHPPAGCSAEWIRRAPYSLTELREWLPAKIPKPVYTTGVGRNEDLFRHCVKLAYQPHWAQDHRCTKGTMASGWNTYADSTTPSTQRTLFRTRSARASRSRAPKYSLRHYSEERFSRNPTGGEATGERSNAGTLAKKTTHTNGEPTRRNSWLT